MARQSGFRGEGAGLGNYARGGSRLDADFSAQKLIQFRMLSSHLPANFAKFLGFVFRLYWNVRSGSDHEPVFRVFFHTDNHPSVGCADADSDKAALTGLPVIDERTVRGAADALHYRGPRSVWSGQNWRLRGGTSQPT